MCVMGDGTRPLRSLLVLEQSTTTKRQILLAIAPSAMHKIRDNQFDSMCGKLLLYNVIIAALAEEKMLLYWAGASRTARSQQKPRSVRRTHKTCYNA